MDKKYNIVYILNDHQAFYGHGSNGGNKVMRPNYERLANEGIEFKRTYSSCPLCGPARRTMLTGLYPHNHGEISNDKNHPFDKQTYLDKLAEGGYQNYYYGKWHAGPGTAHDHQCEGFSYPSYNNPYTKPEYKEYLAAKGLPEPEINIERIFNEWGNQKLELGPGYKQQGNWCNEHASGVMTTPNETHEAFFLANLACDKLRELAASTSEQPFHLRLDFYGPHPPYFPTQEYADMYDPSEIPEHPSFSDDLTMKPDIYHYENNRPLNRDNRLIIPSALAWTEWQKVLARAYAQTTLIDAAGGMLLDLLDELGLSENTLVIWTTDHGDALASHGGHFDKDAYLPEEVLRIPCAMRLPKEIPAGQKSEELVGTIDFGPTMLAAAGMAFDEKVDGQNLLPLASQQVGDLRQHIVSETHGHCLRHKGRALVGQRFKYVYNQPQLDELYDLKTDPYELINLVYSEQHQEILTKMKAQLKDWRIKHNDI